MNVNVRTFKVAAGFAALAARTKSKGHWIGLNPVAGDENMALFLGGYPSFAAAEEARKADDASVAASPALRALPTSARLDSWRWW